MAAPENKYEALDLDGLLAQANLHRLRGQYPQAIEVLNKLLENRPFHSDGNVLMGDIALDEGKLDEARLWYSNAVDHGAGPVATKKLRELDLRIDAESESEIHRRLGLEAARGPNPWTLALGIVSVFLFASLVYLMASGGGPAALTPLRVPVSINESQQITGNEVPTENTPKTVERRVEVPIVAASTEDKQIQAALEAIGGYKEVLRQVAYDTEESHAIVTFEIPEDANASSMASEYGVASQRALPDVKILTIRILQNGRQTAVKTFGRPDDSNHSPQNDPAPENAR